MRLETEGKQFGFTARCRVYRKGHEHVAEAVYETEGFYPFAVLKARLWMALHV